MGTEPSIELPTKWRDLAESVASRSSPPTDVRGYAAANLRCTQVKARLSLRRAKLGYRGAVYRTR